MRKKNNGNCEQGHSVSKTIKASGILEKRTIEKEASHREENVQGLLGLVLLAQRYAV